jgi:N-sulfoglucosamine sulfohydrolase
MALRRQSMTLLIISWLCVITIASAHAADRPNILWITAEDMSPTLGCWGDEYAYTPNIDALAKESVIYTQAFATAPVCSPARSCLISGCYATSLGTQRLRSAFPIPDRIVGFPSLLRQAGYYCTNNVKTDYNVADMAAMIRDSWDACSSEANWRGRAEGQPFFAVFNHMTSHQSRTMVWPYDQFRSQVQSQLPPDKIHDPDLAPVPPYYPDTPRIRKCVARYYDCVSVMDQEVGQLLEQLEQDGLAEDTIVFFYSDHGSGMPRHKRLILDSGLHVPLLVRFPKKYQHLAPAQAGERLGRLVSFVDFPPTVLKLCGIEVPSYMQGLPFLSQDVQPGQGDGLPRRSYVYGARDRVDEAYDLARSVRDNQYLYVRNFMPHLSYNQPSFYSDQGEIRDEIRRFAREHWDELSPAQRHYVAATRPLEELYDVQADPQNLHNLAESAEHQDTLKRMRRELARWMLETRDAGFLPEAEAWRRAGHSTVFELVQDPERYPLQRIIQAASLVGVRTDSLATRVQMLHDDDAAVRYWAAVGFVAMRDRAKPVRKELMEALEDASPAVRIEAATALVDCGESEQALAVLVNELENEDGSVALHAARTIELLDVRTPAVIAAMKAARSQAAGPGDMKMFMRFVVDAFLEGP